MKYLIALLCPPVAILMCGHVFLFLISIPLCFFYFPAALLALLVVAAYYERHHDDRYVERSLKIESGYQKIMKDHYRALNSSIKEDTKMAKLERKQKAKAAAALIAAPTPAIAATVIIGQAAGQASPARPRTPLLTRVKQGYAALVPAQASAKEAAILAYHELPEWAQPITWGLAAATPLSVAFVLVMTLKH